MEIGTWIVAKVNGQLVEGTYFERDLGDRKMPTILVPFQGEYIIHDYTVFVPRKAE